MRKQQLMQATFTLQLMLERLSSSCNFLTIDRQGRRWKLFQEGSELDYSQGDGGEYTDFCMEIAELDIDRHGSIRAINAGYPAAKTVLEQLMILVGKLKPMAFECERLYVTVTPDGATLDVKVIAIWEEGRGISAVARFTYDPERNLLQFRAA